MALTSRLMKVAMLGLNSQYLPRMVEVAAASEGLTGGTGETVRQITANPQILDALLDLVGDVTEGDTIDAVLLRVASDPVKGPQLDQVIQGAVAALKAAAAPPAPPVAEEGEMP